MGQDPSGLYEGFANSPTETAIFVVILVVFFVVLPAIGALRSHQNRRKLRSRARNVFKSLQEKFGLTAVDQRVIKVMARYLHENQKPHLLLENQALFDAAAQQSIQDGLVSKQEIHDLRTKLGFGPKYPKGTISSSADIQAGMPVVLMQKGLKPQSGLVCEPHKGLMCVQLRTQTIPFDPDAEIEVVFHNASGVYRFESRMKDSEGNMIFLAHSGQLERVQRRQFYRARVKLPVYVKRVGVNEEPSQTHFIDLSAGGAAIDNSSIDLSAGEHVALAFFPGTERHLSVVGRVVRTSLRNRKAHISFRNLKPAAQDRLYGFVMQHSGNE
ncbi:MAG: flagellar brake protein [Spirochaeta sp.]